MLHKTKFLYILTFLLILSPTLAVETISTNNHRIQKLTISTNPAKPKIGEAINITANFTLRSPTGFDDDRLRAYFNRVNGTALSGTYKFGEPDAEAKTVPVEFTTTQARTLNRSQTEVIFQYLLTSTQVQDEPPLAQKSKIITASGRVNSGGNGNSGGGGGNNSGGGGGGANGDPSIVEQAFYLDVFEETSVDIGSVSLQPKKLVLSVTHDADLISKVSNGSLFVPELDPVLKALKVKSRKTVIDENGKSKFETTDITTDFTWNVEIPSSPSGELDNYLVTEYISDNLTFLEVQRLNFVVNLANHFSRTQANIPSNLITKDSFKYKINPIGLNLSSIKISPTTLSFNQNTIDAKRNKQLLEMTGATITANLTTTSIDFTQANYDSAKFGNNSRIKVVGKKTKQKIKPNVNSSESLSINTVDSTNGIYKIAIPIEASISTGKSVFSKSKQQIVNSTIDKKLVIPMTINMKSDSSDNGLDLELTGTLDQEVNLNIETLSNDTSG